MRAPEILAPAGDMASLNAALQAGADAVYFGLDEGLNARARARNFPVAELGETCDHIHRAGARAYLTLNTLVFEEELPLLERLLRQAAAAGIEQMIFVTGRNKRAIEDHFDRAPELEQELIRSRRRKHQELELEYLWPLHPLVEWLVDRGLATYGRHEAPVLQFTDGLEPAEVVMVLQGTIPNRSGQPVIQEWVGVRFLGSGLKVEGVEPFAAIAERLQLGQRPYPNRQLPVPDSLKLQRGQAVKEAHAYLLRRREEWMERMQPQLAEQTERLERLRGKQVRQLQLNFEQDGSVLAVKAEKLRLEELKVERLFESHRTYVEDVMTTEEAPYLKLVAVLHRPTDPAPMHPAHES